jgi:ribosome-associated protein
METEKIVSELRFKAVRSSGAGGQNVNKVSSKVVLTFDLNASQALNEEEKVLLETKLATKLTSENLLILNCDEDRSQLKNKEIVIKRFLDLIKKGLTVPKKRKPTKVPRSVVEKRLKDKSSVSEIKQGRKKPGYIWEIMGLIFGIAMFLISINTDEKEHASGKITYNDEGLVSFKSYRMDALYGLLLAGGCIACIVYKKRNP